MGTDFHTASAVSRFRKPHGCVWCKDRIEAGDAGRRLSGKQEGVMFTFYIHPQCDDAWLRDPCNIAGEACEYPHRRGMTCHETTP